MNVEPIESEEPRNEVKTLVAQRSALYALLSRLYEKEVDDALLDQMCSMRLPKSTGNRDVDEAYGMFHRELSNRWERTIEDLSIDYSRVFFGNGSNGCNAAYPFESVHTSSERLMVQDARDEVMTLYKAAGLEKSEDWKDNEDHISLELAYMKVLCDRTVEKLDGAYLEDAINLLHSQYNFLTDHLLNWVSFLVGGIEKFAETDFYRAVGRLTFGFLKEDKVFLKEVLEECGIELVDDPLAAECIVVDDVATEFGDFEDEDEFDEFDGLDAFDELGAPEDDEDEEGSEQDE